MLQLYNIFKKVVIYIYIYIYIPTFRLSQQSWLLPIHQRTWVHDVWDLYIPMGHRWKGPSLNGHKVFVSIRVSRSISSKYWWKVCLEFKLNYLPTQLKYLSFEHMWKKHAFFILSCAAYFSLEFWCKKRSSLLSCVCFAKRYIQCHLRSGIIPTAWWLKYIINI